MIGRIRRGPGRISSVTIALPSVLPISRSGTRITAVTITRDSAGHWWAACTLERRLRPPQQPNERAGAAKVAQRRGPWIIAAGGGSAIQSQGGRREPTPARHFGLPQLAPVEHLTLPAAPYSQLTINALIAPDDAPILAESAAADGMANLRRTIARLQHYFKTGLS